MDEFESLGELNASDVEALGDGLFDGWDDDPITEEAETDEDEQPTEAESGETETEDAEGEDHATEEPAEAETADTPEDKEAEPKPSANPAEEKKYTFTHLDDEPLALTPDEMVPYVSKGLDYDRIRQERDSMKADWAKLKERSDFLEEILGSFDSVEDLMDDTRATILVQNEAENGRTLKKEAALEKVKANREAMAKKPPAKSDAKEEPTAKAEELPQLEDPRQTEVRAFVQTFVDAGEAVPKWEELPKEVRAEFEKTGKLIGPYYRYQMKAKDATINTLKNNKKNEEHSTGSRKTQGAGKVSDPWLAGWDD